jgi:AcrR family transcriptional regulator
MRTKTEEKRQAIIDVAAATFGELGFERTSMSEICTRLGGSKATLYNYFPSKEALFLEVMFQASEADFQNTMLALQAGNDDAAQTLRNFGQRFLGLLYSPEVMAVRRLLVSEGGRANIGQRCWDMGPARGNAAINAFLQQGIERRCCAMPIPRSCAIICWRCWKPSCCRASCSSTCPPLLRRRLPCAPSAPWMPSCGSMAHRVTRRAKATL